MISFHAAKVQTECSIYAAPAGRSSCFLSFYLTECDVSDLIIVTSVAGHASPVLLFLLFSLFSCSPCSNMERLLGGLDQASGLPWSVTKSQKKRKKRVKFRYKQNLQWDEQGKSPYETFMQGRTSWYHNDATSVRVEEVPASNITVLSFTSVRAGISFDRLNRRDQCVPQPYLQKEKLWMETHFHWIRFVYILMHPHFWRKYVWKVWFALVSKLCEKWHPAIFCN